MQKPDITKNTFTAAGPETVAPYIPLTSQPIGLERSIPNTASRGNKPLCPIKTQKAQMNLIESKPTIRALLDFIAHHPSLTGLMASPLSTCLSKRFLDVKNRPAVKTFGRFLADQTRFGQGFDRPGHVRFSQSQLFCNLVLLDACRLWNYLAVFLRNYLSLLTSVIGATKSRKYGDVWQKRRCWSPRVYMDRARACG